MFFQQCFPAIPTIFPLTAHTQVCYPFANTIHCQREIQLKTFHTCVHPIRSVALSIIKCTHRGTHCRGRERGRGSKHALYLLSLLVAARAGSGSALSARGTWHRQGQWKLPAHAICVKQFVVHVLVVTAGATWFNLSRLPRAAHVKTTRYNCNNNNSNNRNVCEGCWEREREGRGWCRVTTVSDARTRADPRYNSNGYTDFAKFKFYSNYNGTSTEMLEIIYKYLWI